MDTGLNDFRMNRKIAKKMLYVYNLYYFSYFFALGVFLPLFPTYLDDVAKFTDDKMGVIFSIGPLVSIFFQPLWGLINDKLHLDKKIVLVGLIILNLSILTIMLNTHFSIISLAMIIYSIFNCAIGPIQDSFTVVYTRQYGFKYGDVRIWGSIGYAIASFIIGYLVLANGYLMIIYISSAAFLVAFISFFRIKYNRPIIDKQVIKRENSLLIVLKNRVFVIFLIFTALSIGIIAAIGNFLVLRIKELGGGPADIGMITAIQVLSEIIVMLYVLKINKGISDFKLLIASIFLQLPVLIIFIFSSDLNLVLYSLIIRGASSGLFIPVIVSFISSILPSDKIAPGITLYSALSINLIGFITTILSGYIARYFSYTIVFIIVFIILLISLIFGHILNKEKNQVVEQL